MFLLLRVDSHLSHLLMALRISVIETLQITLNVSIVLGYVTNVSFSGNADSPEMSIHETAFINISRYPRR